MEALLNLIFALGFYNFHPFALSSIAARCKIQNGCEMILVDEVLTEILQQN